WALDDFGFRCVIAPCFADIIYNNCFKNCLLPVVLSEDFVEQLFRDMYAEERYTRTVDLEQQGVITPADERFVFDVDEFRKHCLIKGLDDLDLTLEDADAIRAYEARRRQQAPWLFAE